MAFTDEYKKAAFSSKTDKYDSPPALVADLERVFDWELDVCASRPNVCERFYDGRERGDGLMEPWEGLCWMNPPYGRVIGKWMARAREQAVAGTAVVCLVPARTDTKWWQENVPAAKLVVFVKGRLRFGNAAHKAPFPSAFVVFGELDWDQVQALAAYGWVAVNRMTRYQVLTASDSSRSLVERLPPMGRNEALMIIRNVAFSREKDS